MATTLYSKGLDHVLSADIDLLADDLKVSICDSTVTYNGTHEFVDDVGMGAGEVARSANLASKTILNGTFDADDLTFATLTGAVVVTVILFHDTGSDATSELIAWFDIGGFTPDGSTATLFWDAAGIFTIS